MYEDEDLYGLQVMDGVEHIRRLRNWSDDELIDELHERSIELDRDRLSELRGGARMTLAESFLLADALAIPLAFFLIGASSERFGFTAMENPAEVLADILGRRADPNDPIAQDIARVIELVESFHAEAESFAVANAVIVRRSELGFESPEERRQDARNRLRRLRATLDELKDLGFERAVHLPPPLDEALSTAFLIPVPGMPAGNAAEVERRVVLQVQEESRENWDLIRTLY